MKVSYCRGTKKFYKDLNKLKKKYKNIVEDIKSEFCDKAFTDLFNRNYKLQDAGNYRLIKYRISNSHNQTGKSGGYRIYYIANLTEQKVTFLTIYPKSNSHGKENLSKDELKVILADYKSENKSRILSDINFEEI
ncbi:MAG: hypothetical protein ACTHXT_12930 [Sphingobacterium sp.]